MVYVVEVVVALSSIAVLLCLPDGPARLRTLCLYGSALTSSWNAVHVAGALVSDWLLAISALLLVRPGLRLSYLPRGLRVGAGLVLVSGLLSTLVPPAAAYINQRFVIGDARAEATGLAQRNGGNLTNLGKFEVALFILPLVYSSAIRLKPSLAQKLGYAWLAGVMLNSLAAYSDDLGLTRFELQVNGYLDTGGRHGGLAAQANHLGVAIAISAPLAMYAITRTGRQRIFGIAALLTGSVGLYVSSSRGAVVATILAVALSYVLMPWYRRSALLGSLVAIAAAVYTLQAGFLASLLVRLRLSSGAANVTAGSDIGRASLLKQGIADFFSSPLHGIGYGYLNDAHLVYAQILAAGGLIGALGLATVLSVGFTARRQAVGVHDPLFQALQLCFITWLAVSWVENQVADRYLYVPLALLVGLWTTGRQVESPDYLAGQAHRRQIPERR